MKNGVYALGTLDGSPSAKRDVVAMFGPQATSMQAIDGVLLGCDRGKPVNPFGMAGVVRLFLGHIDGVDDRLESTADRIAVRQRHSGQDAIHETGEWLYAEWDSNARTFTLAASECLRDPCYLAIAGQHFAVAPALPHLAQLSWVEDSLDPAAILRALRPRAPTHQSRRATMLRQVIQLLPGERLTLSAQGLAIEAARPKPPPPPLVSTGFAEATRELDAAMARIMQHTLAQGGDVALLLSGGLDSSLIAALAVEHRLPGQRLVCLTSAAPPDSGIQDETEWAALVANHLGLPLIRVIPKPDANLYALSQERLLGAGGPLLSPRHFLYDALEDRALAEGASLLLDGAFGELNLSAYGQLQSDDPLRSALRQLRNRLRGPLHGPDTFLARPSAAALATRFHRDRSAQLPNRTQGAVGFAKGYEKSAYRTTDAVDPRLRYAFPFRDRELCRTMAAYPTSYLTHAGMDRAPIRALLQGRLPESVVRRESKMPFSPTYYAMLASQAGNARKRIPAQKAAGADEWLDLDWLDLQLEAAINGATLRPQTWDQVHVTAMFADFVRWWRSERSST
jgi:asparagine synthase (glutamine-hydrolysing)